MSEPRPRSELVWTGSLAAELALALAGFWALLGFRFSPETYQAGPTARGTVELAWFSLAVAATIVALAWLRRHANASRRWALAGLPLALVSLFMLIRWMAGLELKCYDAILFSAASGWVLALAHASRKAAGPTGPETELAAAAHRAATPSMALLWTFGLVLGGYYFWQQTGYWRNLALGYADVGIIARVMHNTIHEPGELFLRAGPDAPLFYDHFQPGILPLVPLWAVWPDLRLVILFQIVATLGSAVPLYWIGRKMFSDKRCAVLLALAWLVYPSTSQFIYNASYGFRWGSFCIPLYFVALACWLHGRTGWAIAAAAWALLIKEEAAIVLGMFGLYLALFGRQPRTGVALAAIAFGYFLLMSSVVIPAMGEGRYVVESYFDDLGPSKWEILLSPLQKPAVFWGKISAPTTFYFAASLLAPLLFVPLRKPSVLSIGALTFLFIALWDNPMAKSICFQYQAGLLPVVFWGLARALTDKPMPSLLQDTRSVLRGAVVGGVTLSIFLGNAFWSKSNLSVRPVPGRLDLVKHISADIDPNATLSTSGRLAAHFMSQKGLYVLPNGLSRADYALLDLRHAWRPLPGLGWLRELRDCQRQIEAQPHLHLVAAEDGLLLYSRFGAPLDRRGMVERDRLPGGATPTQMQLGHAVQVRGVLTLPLDPDKQRRMARARVCVFSAVAAEAATDLAARCILTFGSGTSDEESYASEFQPLGQAIWPVTRWQTGTLHEDCFLMSFPEEFSRKPMEIRLEVGAF